MAGSVSELSQRGWVAWGGGGGGGAMHTRATTHTTHHVCAPSLHGRDAILVRVVLALPRLLQQAIAAMMGQRRRRDVVVVSGSVGAAGAKSTTNKICSGACGRMDGSAHLVPNRATQVCTHTDSDQLPPFTGSGEVLGPARRRAAAAASGRCSRGQGVY